ncbi:hypothetical protein AMS66_21190 [Paenibacillus xylanivorans]|uniref:Uncharacterized protein n=1 Tax=Paenibacillus xylanivorans TaxID=1705561 RepID=A0A0M9BMS3_9BACL|nr:hypothetical protein AMS66_21190 [Paenibacillus xylanivorans]
MNHLTCFAFLSVHGSKQHHLMIIGLALLCMISMSPMIQYVMLFCPAYFMPDTNIWALRPKHEHLP